MKSIEQLTIIILGGNLSENKELKNIIPKVHPETNTHHAHLKLILISLFIL